MVSCAWKGRFPFKGVGERMKNRLEELRRAYPNILEISYEMLVEADPREDAPGEALARESAETLFSRFYEEMTGTELTPYQRELLAGCAELVGRNAE